jgi:hypothetical protein
VHVAFTQACSDEFFAAALSGPERGGAAEPAPSLCGCFRMRPGSEASALPGSGMAREQSIPPDSALPWFEPMVSSGRNWRRSLGFDLRCIPTWRRITKWGQVAPGRDLE